MPNKTLKSVIKLFQRNCPEDWISKCRPFSKDTGIISTIKAILGAECQFNTEWIQLEPTLGWSQYWEGCVVTLPDGTQQEGILVAERFKKGFSESIETVDTTQYQYIESPQGWRIQKFSEELSLKSSEELNLSSEEFWIVEAKLILTQGDLDHLLNLLVAFVPPGKTVSLQADSHRAGNCWVGLVCSYDETRIPFIPISADIGCGMCMLPVLSQGRQLTTQNAVSPDSVSEVKSLTMEEFKKLQIQVGYRTRSVLARGKRAETGQCFSVLLSEVLTYLNDKEFHLQEWLDDFDFVFKALDIQVPTPKGPEESKKTTEETDTESKETDTESKETVTEETNTEGNSEIPEICKDLTSRQYHILKFVAGFGMTLGSSGNHFLELNEGSDGRLYVVVHSGSRGLGSMVYDQISNICSTLYGVNATAVGKYVELYNHAYSALNKFAVMNRLLCAIAVLKDLGLDWNGAILKEYLINKNPLFSGIQQYPQEVTKLIRGVTHNGIKCFVNHTTKQKIFLLCKGSIAISKKASCGIVALRAGDGVAVLTMLNPEAKWEECDLRQVSKLNCYELIHDLSQTDIQLIGHGAGRSGSATKTWKNSEYLSMIEYYQRHQILSNLSPNVLGDNPEIAYKPIEEVRKHIPEKEAWRFDLLRTRVNHKEGIEYRYNFRKKFANFIVNHWSQLSEEWKLMCDLVLATDELRKLLGKPKFADMVEEQKQIYLKLTE